MVNCYKMSQLLQRPNVKIINNIKMFIQIKKITEYNTYENSCQVLTSITII